MLAIVGSVIVLASVIGGFLMGGSSLLLLWPTLSALWLASHGRPDWQLIVIFSLGTVLMRSAGCAINDYADRDFDRHVKRTADRPLTAGRIKPWEALAVFAFLSLVALSLIISYNKLTWLMAAIAAFLAVSYPFTKRFLSIPQAYLGIAFGFGIPMAFAATTNAAPPLCWVLLLANIFWAIAYDTEYAMVDRDDDLRIGMKTSAITLGQWDVPAVMWFYVLHLTLWAICLQPLALGWPWQLALTLAGIQALGHYFLIRQRQREGCFQAFRLNHWLGFAVFAGTAQLHGFREGAMQCWPAAQYKEILAGRTSPKAQGAVKDSKVLMLDFTSDTQALAKVSVRIGEMVFVDYLSYHKIGGNWLVTSKAYHRAA